jgi:hypothetical protein
MIYHLRTPFFWDDDASLLKWFTTFRRNIVPSSSRRFEKCEEPITQWCGVTSRRTQFQPLHRETLRTRKLFFLLSVSDCVGLSENGLNCSYVHHHHRCLVLRRLSELLVWQDLLQGYTNPGWLYFVRWLIMFVGHQYGTFFMSPVRYPELWGGF